MASPAQAASPPANPEAPAPPPTSPPRQRPDDEQDEHETPERPPPLFTLVHNSTSRTTHHPHVHYIFADDDPEVLTRALTASDPAASGGDATRSVLLDLAPGDDGWQVAHAASLSADWAVVDAGLRAMEGAEGQEGGAGGLMLRIEGVEGEGGGTEGVEGGEEYGALLGEFERRMGVLRRVVGAGEARRTGLLEGRGEVEGPQDTEEKTEEEQGAEEGDEKDKGPRDDQAQPGSPAGG